jgi:hypothetical protein
MGGRVRWCLAVTAVLLFSSAGFVAAQFGMGREFNFPPRMAPEVLPDAKFAPCRLMYTQVRREQGGGGWRTDYPDGELNLTIRFSELTRTRVSWNAGREHSLRGPEPNHWVVRLTDDALFQCPFTIASDIGTIGLQDGEAERLREYLLKGGFLWVDDFWGTDAWHHWTAELAKALPPSTYPIEDVPFDDPIFSSLFVVTHVPQVPNIGFWRRTGGQTSERGSDSPEATFRVVRDTDGRIMVVMTHNTDLADAWEREGEDPQFFYQFSPDAYALGINVLLHAMTH